MRTVFCSQLHNSLFQGIVDQTINARSTASTQGAPDHDNWAHRSSVSQSLLSVGMSAALSVGLGDGTRTYPDTTVVRDVVPPFYRSWGVVYLGYNPPSYSQDLGPQPDAPSTGSFPLFFHAIFSIFLQLLKKQKLRDHYCYHYRKIICIYKYDFNLHF